MPKKFRYTHISSAVENKVPESLLDGEIAVNKFAGKEKLFIKNTNDDIVPFIPEHTVVGMVESYEDKIQELEYDINSCSDRIDELEKETGLYYKTRYLTFIPEQEEVTFSFHSLNDENVLYYSLNKGKTWEELQDTVTVHSGETIMWKGNMLPYHEDEFYGIGTFSSDGNFSVESNIMSLLYSDDFKEQTTLSGACTFIELFSDCTGLTSAENLSLPATILTEWCYASMFDGCTSLVQAPELPATTLAESCYDGMFAGCTLLTSAPELPATTLADYCYNGMFAGCTLLTSAPALPATTLIGGCYQSMFYGCTSLTSAPALPATTLATMCYYQMFNGCTSLVQAPELPATTLTISCYQYMFSGCSSLSAITCLATDISATDCTYNWLANVSPTGIFTKVGGVDWELGSPNGIPQGWTVVSNYDKQYLTFIAKENSTAVLFSNDIGDNANKIEYSIDGGDTWHKQDLDSETGISILNAGDKIMWRASGLTVGDGSQGGAGIGNFVSVILDGENPPSEYAPVDVEGNIMSLVYGDDFTDKEVLTNTFQFAYLFANYWEFSETGDTIISAENLVLPATTLTEGCYSNMFSYCTSLVNTPELPATTLAVGCYASMFEGCTSLTSAPELPATTLTEWCYVAMFNGCTSLSTAPELPATTLTNGCYSEMFVGCTGIITAPELPATTLTDYCYANMFEGCTSLSAITCLATDISADNCTTNWLANVSPTGTFTKMEGMNDWVLDSPNGVPQGWTVKDYLPPVEERYLTFITESSNVAFNFVKTEDVEGDAYYSINGNEWVLAESGVNTPKLNTGDNIRWKGDLVAGEYGIGNFTAVYIPDTPSISSINETRILGAESNDITYFRVEGNIMSLLYMDDFKDKVALTEYNVFNNLFENCTGLTSVDNIVLPATTLTMGCYSSMFQGCTSLVNTPELPATTLANNCYQEMFEGCTSLVQTPELSATTLTMGCYSSMFFGCSSLSAITCLATDISASNCTTSWVSNVSPTGVFIKNPSMTGWTIGTNGIPQGWTVEDVDGTESGDVNELL